MPSSDHARKAPEPTFRRSLLTWLRNGGIYVGTLVLVALLIEPRLPYPEIPGAGEKIRYLSMHGNEYEAIFVGSSRVNFQVLPSVFDRTLAESGRPMKSFNCGLLGMRPPEEGYFLEEVLKQPRGKLRWVLIELTSLEARTPVTRRGSARYLSWHDGPRMGLLWQWVRGEWEAVRVQTAAAGGKPTLAERWEPLSVWLMHFGYFCKNTLNLGRAEFVGATWIIAPSKRAKQRNRFRSLGEDRDGWIPYDGERETMTPQERAAYLETYEARLATPAVRFHEPGSDAAMEAMRQAVLRAGATPIFFVPPMTTDRHYYPPPEMARNMIIWNFSDPKSYPTLFLPEHRLDPVHTNTAGGKEFTRALAARFSELPH